MIPMLLYAQDELGSCSPELMAEVASRIGVTPLQVEEVMSYYSIAACQAAWKVQCPDLH